IDLNPLWDRGSFSIARSFAFLRDSKIAVHIYLILSLETWPLFYIKYDLPGTTFCRLIFGNESLRSRRERCSPFRAQRIGGLASVDKPDHEGSCRSRNVVPEPSVAELVRPSLPWSRSTTPGGTCSFFYQ